MDGVKNYGADMGVNLVLKRIPPFGLGENRKWLRMTKFIIDVSKIA